MSFDKLRCEFKDPEYAHSYADGFLDSYIATQIKVLRESRGWTQSNLAEEAGMRQSRISTMEDVNYSAWSISTLRRIAKAFNVRLKVSFEEFGTLLPEITKFSREYLLRRPLEADPVFQDKEDTGSISRAWVASQPKSRALGSIINLSEYRQNLGERQKGGGRSAVVPQQKPYEPLALQILNEPPKQLGVVLWT